MASKAEILAQADKRGYGVQLLAAVVAIEKHKFKPSYQDNVVLVGHPSTGEPCFSIYLSQSDHDRLIVGCDKIIGLDDSKLPGVKIAKLRGTYRDGAYLRVKPTE